MSSHNKDLKDNFMSLSNQQHSVEENRTTATNHPFTTVKKKVQDIAHVTAQKLKLEPRERNPEAAHQDGKTNP
ncbi:7885_t:CDS:1, partial [Dentiscutata erythropus]